MPGSNNRVQFANGYRLESSAAEEWQIMQATANDVSCVNNAGNPEGVVPANMGSLCHDRTNGNLYVKHTGTGTTGWLLIATGTGTDLHTARFIVSAGGITDGANYTDVPTAYAAAVAAGAPQTVFLQPGTYTFNQILTPGINISAYSCDAWTPNVIIKGKLTLTAAGTVSISGCQLLTNADFAISCTGANLCKILMVNCKLFANDANGIEFTNSNGNSKIEFYSSIGDLAATRAYFTHSGAGKISFFHSIMGNNGASTTASTSSGSGSVDINSCYFANAITTSSTSVFTMGSSSYHGALIAGGTGAGQSITESLLDGGTSASVSIGAGVTMKITNCTIESTNGTAAISGAGILQHAGLVFSNSATNITTTTQTLLNEGPSKTIGTATSGGTNTLTVTNSSNTASSNAAIVATVGGTSAADAYYQAVVSGTTTWSWGVDNSDSDAWVLSASATPGTTNVMRASTAGEINYPLQPSFFATSTAVADVTGDGTVYTIIFGTEIFDQGADFDGTSTFTAPVTGRYRFDIKTAIEGLTASHTGGDSTLVTSNRSLIGFTLNWGAVRNASNQFRCQQTWLTDMDAADTATVTISITGGTKVVDTINGYSFSGDLNE